MYESKEEENKTIWNNQSTNQADKKDISDDQQVSWAQEPPAFFTRINDKTFIWLRRPGFKADTVSRKGLQMMIAYETYCHGDQQNGSFIYQPA